MEVILLRGAEEDLWSAWEHYEQTQPGLGDGFEAIDLEGRIVKDGVRKVVKDRQLALEELVKAIREFRKFTDQPLTLRGGDYAGAVQALNKAIERAELLLA